MVLHPECALIIYPGLNGPIEEILALLYIWAELLHASRTDEQYQVKQQGDPPLDTPEGIFLTQMWKHLACQAHV